MLVRVGKTDPAKNRFDTFGQKTTSQAESICKKNTNFIYFLSTFYLVQYSGAARKSMVAMKEKCDLGCD